MRRATEAGFLRGVLRLAKLCGWRTAHFRTSRTNRGWRTAVQGDGRGFVDIVLVRGGRLLFVEAKSDTGRLSPDQRAWLAALRQVPGVEVWEWRPADWEHIEQVLA
jgi:VRR-NUC domain